LLTYRAINNNIRLAGRDTTAATQGSTIQKGCLDFVTGVDGALRSQWERYF